jgi:hypothetical protein
MPRLPLVVWLCPDPHLEKYGQIDVAISVSGTKHSFLVSLRRE